MIDCSGVNPSIDLTASRQLTRARRPLALLPGENGVVRLECAEKHDGKGGDFMTKIKRFASAFAQPIFWTSLFVAQMGSDRYPWR